MTQSIKWPFQRCALWFRLALLLVVATTPACAQTQPHPVTQSLTSAAEISTEPVAGGSALFEPDHATVILVDPNEDPGILRAVRNMQADLERRGPTRPEIRTAIPKDAVNVIVVGSIENSHWIGDLAERGLVEMDGLKHEWEAFSQEVVAAPFPGIERALVIAGSDKRGTIFGVYDLLDRAGISPWVWWADVPIQRVDALYVGPGKRVEKPVVKYRGIFLNDENPALYGWVNEKFSGFNHTFYERVFELLLRQKANYIWPAMWGKAFYDDDPLNAVLADEYGIVIGTSHHEPLGRAHVEWERYGSGDWNYSTNPETLRSFWREGIERIGDHEAIITIGMRGDGDEAMAESTATDLLEEIVADQRDIIAEVTGNPAAETPQLWALYKEVQDYYDKGMRVPDDVTLLFADDNWGNIRRLPEPGAERPGGYGVYYHFDYVGDPRNYKWINTTQIERVWEQMNLAHGYGANQIWIVNVGDLKPMEFPISFFLDMAWDPDDLPLEALDDYPARWAEDQFGPNHAEEIGHLLSSYTKYNARRKPELLEAGTYSLIHRGEADRIVSEYNSLASRATALRDRIAPEYRDAYLQLVWFPIAAAANLNELYITAAKNDLYAKQGRAATNAMADRVAELYARDAELTRIYHEDISAGKWNHLMSQTHIGYTYWQQPETNSMPAITRIEISEGSRPGVAVPGSNQVSMGEATQLSMPTFDPYSRSSQSIEIFNGGKTPFNFDVRMEDDWIRVQSAGRTVTTNALVTIDIDWTKAPLGKATSKVWIISDETRIPVTVPTHKFVVPASKKLFVEMDGIVSFHASNAHRLNGSGSVAWAVIPNLGRTADSITSFPVTAPSHSPGAADASSLEYDVFVAEPGTYSVAVTLAPSLDFRGKGGLRYGVSANDESPQIVNMNSDPSQAAWAAHVANYANVQTTKHTFKTAGAHTIKLWRVDPGVVFQHVTVSRGDVPATYLELPESFRSGQ